MLEISECHMTGSKPICRILKGGAKIIYSLK